MSPDNTKRHKRDMQADYTPDSTRPSRRVSTAETLRYPWIGPPTQYSGIMRTSTHSSSSRKMLYNPPRLKASHMSSGEASYFTPRKPKAGEFHWPMALL